MGSIKKQSFYDQADRKGEGVSAPMALAVHLIVWGLKNAFLMPLTPLLYHYLTIQPDRKMFGFFDAFPDYKYHDSIIDAQYSISR